MNIDLKRVYYYVIALISFFVLLWGAIDLASASLSMVSGRYVKPPVPEKLSEPGLEEYYQQKVAQDRVSDSLARIVVSGVIFAYAKFTLNKLERS